MNKRILTAIAMPALNGRISRTKNGLHRFFRKDHKSSLWPAVVVFLALSPCLAADEDPRIAASRDYTSRLQEELSGKLKTAMQQGGPISAIEVCQIEAPRIAVELSSSGEPARVWRTASKIRNPDNTADEEALRTLEQFTLSLSEGKNPPLSEFITYPDGSARYMQSIILQPPCLACHGAVLAENVQATLAERYPDDEATGFSVGDLRGAFVVDWSAQGK